MAEPRKHHFVPAFYLAGFTIEKSQTARLYAITKPDARVIAGTPRTLGYERDLYRVEHPELDPNEVERAFAEVEGQAAPALGRLVDDSAHPKVEDISVVLYLAALLAIRVPAVRKTMAEPIKQFGERFADMVFQHPERYERYLKEQEAQGMDVSGYPTFERLKQGWETGGFELHVNKTFMTVLGLKLSRDVYECLCRRFWVVASCEQMSTGPLVTSDRPVAIYWTRGNIPAFYGPGFMLPDTEVAFPLDRRHVLMGFWDEHAARVKLSREQVAMLNGQMCLIADRHVFTVSERFFALDRDRRVTTGKSFIEQYGAL